MQRLVLGLVLAAGFLCSCSERKEQQPREPETASTLRASETAAAQSEARVPSDVEMRELLALQNRILQNPEEVALRRELGAKAIAAEAGVVWSVGLGRISASAASLHVAQNQAELAARIDAARWAAYLLEWRRNGFATAFSALQAQVPGGEVVNKIQTDSTYVVLLRTALQ